MADEFSISGDFDDVAGEGDDVGYDVGYDVGRRKPRRDPPGLARAPMSRGPALAAGPYGGTVRAVEPKSVMTRYQVFGLGQVTTAAPGGWNLSQTFQESFRAERLVLNESVANDNVIQGIFVGVRPQSANIAAIPLAAFASNAFETRVQFDTGQPGQVFQVVGTSAAGSTISGMAFGTVLKAG